ncbi:DUF7426 family protein [Timonella senegalensis]|uniref:DUF7426 family protein n=1 Tax=Timonella senegalensis TaxID=1465825 RepID=UPI0028AAAAD4|nr:hypothetical protein [Timonella senegalensis]
MGFKDVQQYLTPHLELPVAGKTYLVPPPSKDDGLLLAAMVAVGYNTANGHAPAVGDSALLLANRDRNVEDVALTPAIHAQMLEDGVPGAHILQAGLYAMYYWTTGEEGADAAFKTIFSEAGAGTLPKVLKLLKIGPSTASESQTRTASTRGTGSRRTPSDRKAPSAKKAASRGSSSSQTGGGSSQTSPSTTD